MSRRVQLLGLLVALLAGLEAALLLTHPRVRPAPRLLELEPLQVERIEITRAGRPPLSLARAGASQAGEPVWVVRSHQDLPAIGPAVEGLLQRVLSWRRERRASSDPAAWPAQQVTEEAARHLRLYGPGEALLGEVLVGAITGIEPEDVRDKGYSLDTTRLGLFVRLRGEETTWVVTDFLTRELEPDPRPWLPRPLALPPREAIARVLVERGPERFALLLQGGPPRLEPGTIPADAAAAGGVLLNLETLETLGPGPSTPPPADALRLRLETREGQALELVAWGAGGQVFLLPAGARALEVGGFGAPRLLQLERAGLVRRRALGCARDDLEQVALPWGLLQRGPRGWRLEREGQPPRELEQARVDAALERLESLTVLEWDAAAPAPPPGSPGLRWLGRGVQGGLMLGATEGPRRAVRIEVGPPGWVEAAAAAAVWEALEGLDR